MGDFEKEIIERLQRIETLQETMEERNRAEHQEIMVSIKDLRASDSKTATMNGTQNERLVKLETAFGNYAETEKENRNAFMWRFGIFVSLLSTGVSGLANFLVARL